MGSGSRTVLVGYGTETGISHDIAEQLSRMALRLRLETELCEMNKIQLSSLLRHSLVVFVVSTTGLGEMPKNASQLWKRLLRKKLAPRCLEGARLAQLGASEAFPRGEGDQQHPDGIDQVFIPWLASFRQFLLEEFPLPLGTEPISESEALPPQIPLLFTDRKVEPHLLSPHIQEPTELEIENPQTSNSEINTVKDPNDIPGERTPETQLAHKFGMMEISKPTLETPSNVPVEIPSRIFAKLSCNTRITPKNHWQDVRLLKFQISAAGQDPGTKVPTFMPGDTLNLYAKNFPIDVDNLIKWMGWTGVATNTINWASMGSIPSDLLRTPEFTLRDLLLHSLDIFAVPSRTFFEKLSYFAADEDQKIRLFEFSQSQFTDEYYDYASRPRRSILEVLQEFDTVRIPAHAVLDIFPVIRPRQYSIANWPQVGGGAGSAEDTVEIELVVALVKYRTVLRRVRRGLVSRYLEDLPEGTEMYVSHTASSSRIYGPENARRPLVCVATGTGIAPIRSLVQERRSHVEKGGTETEIEMPTPTTDLYFGCRNRESDFHFGGEWQHLEEHGVISLHTAFSRDAQTKVYVQDILRTHKKQLAAWVKSDAIFFVCGGSRRMADAVKRLVKDAMVEYREVEAEQHVDAAFRGVSWIEEIW
ncbi:NADPH-dependent diflavin oxidoreductase 1 [Ceratocystis lukuohia]|uniref:NADPH-dependent diflavin oxidoreductase 1 n=1 Tax=Ceratocystis lukuohia TaxID=2019550 RepID=A0ABR4MHY6_9PEZI